MSSPGAAAPPPAPLSAVPMELPLLSASGRVITTQALLGHVMSFLDGVPGLLRDINTVKLFGDDLVATIVKHPQNQRALEMVGELYEQPKYRDRRLREYQYGAIAAIELNDLQSLRWLCEHVDLDRVHADRLWYAALYHHQLGDYTIVETLLAQFPLQRIQDLYGDTWDSISSLELFNWVVDHIPGLEFDFEKLFKNAVHTEDLGLIDYILDHHADEAPANSFYRALHDEKWASFLRLCQHERYTAGDEDRRHRLLEAVDNADLAKVKALLCRALQPPPVEALERAAELGFYEVVDEIYHRYASEMVLSHALTLAASNGHLRIVEFIVETGDTVDTSDAMDSAAEKGHLSVIERLHAEPYSRCTTKAMDLAATNGHLAIVEFLHAERDEGCTKDALIGAAANGHRDVVRFLLTAMKADTDDRTDRLVALLLNGYFDEWLAHRDASGADDYVLQDVMREAGAKGKAQAIRFIFNWREDDRDAMMLKAMEGAARLGSVEWIDTVHKICGGGPFVNGTASAVEAAIDAEGDTVNLVTSTEERLDVAKWLILHAQDVRPAIGHAIEYATMKGRLAKQEREAANDGAAEMNNDDDEEELPEDRFQLIATALESWRDTGAAESDNELRDIRFQYASHAFTFVAHGAGSDWLIEHAAQKFVTSYTSLEERQEAEGADSSEELGSLLGPKTYSRLAIERNDLAVLQLLFDARDDMADDPAFAFDDDLALRCAIAAGHTDAVRWCIDTLYDGSVDADALGTAVAYAQPHVADWLLAEYPACIDDVDQLLFQVYPEYTTNSAVFEWLNNLESTYPDLVECLRPYDIVKAMVGTAPASEVTAWVDRHPEVVDDLGDLLCCAVLTEKLSAVELVYDLIVQHDVMETVVDGSGMVEQAMASAAMMDKLDIVEFLFDRFPDTDWYEAVQEAANFDRPRVFRFFLANGYEDCAEEEQFKVDGRYAIRLLCFLCENTEI